MANQQCTTCGNSMDANAAFCPNCGAKPGQQPYTNSAPNYAPPVYAQPVQPYYPNNDAINSQPLGVGQYIVMFILMGIPLVGFILMLVWAFGSNVNKNKKNYARATLIVGIIGGILAAIFSGIIIAALTPMINDLISQMGGSYY